MKTCAVMQPYLFPYIGYYQLVNASDIFIIYDDVTFIKKSYINRNSILSNRKSQRFTMPILSVSQNTLIKDLVYAEEKKILKTIKLSYSKAPYFKEVYQIISSVFLSEDRSVAKVNELSIRKVFEYLDIEKEIAFASELTYNRDLERADRLIELSNKYGCNHYINTPGGKELYNKEYFGSQGIRLSFIESHMTSYKQFQNEFLPNLSIIDVLMFNSVDDARDMLNSYELV